MFKKTRFILNGVYIFKQYKRFYRSYKGSQGVIKLQTKIVFQPWIYRFGNTEK